MYDQVGTYLPTYLPGMYDSGSYAITIAHMRKHTIYCPPDSISEFTFNRRHHYGKPLRLSLFRSQVRTPSC